MKKIRSFVQFFVFTILFSSQYLIAEDHSEIKNESTPTLVDSILKTDFKDQFEKNISLTEQTQYIIFAKEKSETDIINKTFEELNTLDFTNKNILYVADISKMPSMITKMFALPKMQKYKYRIALDNEAQTTSKWPYKEKHISIIKLDRLKISEIKYLNSQKDFTTFIQSLNLK